MAEWAAAGVAGELHPVICVVESGTPWVLSFFFKLLKTTACRDGWLSETGIGRGQSVCKLQLPLLSKRKPFPLAGNQHKVLCPTAGQVCQTSLRAPWKLPLAQESFSEG